jgi:hypothetical protein
MLKKTVLVSIAIICSTKLIEIHKNLCTCYILRKVTLLFKRFTSARKQLQLAVENNQLLYSLHYSLLTPYVLITHQVRLQEQSLSKRLQTYNHLSREQNCAEQHRP